MQRGQIESLRLAGDQTVMEKRPLLLYTKAKESRVSSLMFKRSEVWMFNAWYLAITKDIVTHPSVLPKPEPIHNLGCLFHLEGITTLGVTHNLPFYVSNPLDDL